MTMAGSSKFWVGSIATNGRPIEHFSIQDPESLSFLGEQDGPPERRLKEALCPALENFKIVQSAYLARVQYPDETDWSVALCLRSSGEADHTLIRRIAEVFAMMRFNRAEHLDIINVSHDQWQRLRAVCKPFYVRD